MASCCATSAATPGPLRQGLLALAHGQPVYEDLTRRMLRARGLLRADGVPTAKGRARAAEEALDEARWQELRRAPQLSELAARDDGLTRIEDILTRDQIAAIDARLGPRGAVA
ncbi:hypothetical protein [Sagittula stellata]|uniref:Zinc/manganese/iron ABC transporter, permease protein n=1 Tax=Sagittula stellata (strain ATCC 700073 / DSM 11524 / E-37) TaxID=388399 RepID=A3KBE7_SAGS3|nr:hypothetical protein [Sagittula stellata]EBA05503.1 zinc/manganese/iron ABC transporter, permease protein [Sagittula stellata E-37]